MVGVGTWKAMRLPGFFFPRKCKRTALHSIKKKCGSLVMNHIRNCGKLKNHTFLNGRKVTNFR
jgi:hypothetical protein